MANEKISELPTVTPVQANDLVPIVRGGQNFAVHAGDIAAEAVALSAGTSIVTSGTAFFINSNNVSMGFSNQTITFSASYPTTLSAYVTGNTTGQSSNTVLLDQTLSISAVGQVSAGFSNGMLVLNATSPVQTSQPSAISGSNTSQTALTQSFGNSNGLSFYLTNGSMVGSYTVPATAGLLSNIAVSGSNTSQTLTGVTFSNSNNVSFGLSSGTITASASYAAGPNYTINGGQTTGTLTLINSGTLSFAGIGNITLSQVGNAISISGGTAVTNPSPIEVTASNASVNAATLQFQNSNNVTFGLSTGGNIATLTASIPVQSAQTEGWYASSQTVGQSSSSTFDARSITVVGQGIISAGISAGSLLLSATTAAQTNQTAGIYGSSQTTGQSSSSTYDARSLTVVGQGNVSVGWSNSSLLVSGAGQSVGVSNIGNTSGNTGTYSGRAVFAGGNNITLSVSSGAAGAQTITVSGPNAQTGISGIAVSNSTYTSGTVTFSNSNGITFGSGGANIVTASYNSTQFAGSGTTFSGTNCFGSITLNSAGIDLAISALAAGGASSAAVYAQGNTTGQSSSSTYAQSSFNVSAAGIISAGWSNSSLIISAPASTGISQSLYATSNTTQSSSGTAAIGSILFNGAGGVSVGVTNGSVVISGGGGVGVGVSTGGNTAGSTGTVTTGNAVFVGVGVITLSQSTAAAGSNATISILAPATSSLVGTSGLSVSTNGSTISVYPIGASRYVWPNTPNITAVSAPGNASASVQYVPIYEALVASRVDALMGWSGSSSATANTCAIALSAYCAVYTRMNSSQLGSVSSGSTQTTYSYASNTAGATAFTQSAVRPISCPVNISATAGEYWVGFNIITATSSVGTATTNLGQTLSMYGGNDFQTAVNIIPDATVASATSNGIFSIGVYASATTGLPATISASALNMTGASASQGNLALIFRNY